MNLIRLVTTNGARNGGLLPDHTERVDGILPDTPDIQSRLETRDHAHTHSRVRHFAEVYPCARETDLVDGKLRKIV